MDHGRWHFVSLDTQQSSTATGESHEQMGRAANEATSFHSSILIPHHDQPCQRDVPGVLTVICSTFVSLLYTANHGMAFTI